MDKDYLGTPSTNDPGGGSPSVGSTSNTIDDKDTLSGGSTNNYPRVPVISALPTSRLLQILMRRVSLLF